MKRSYEPKLTCFTGDWLLRASRGSHCSHDGSQAETQIAQWPMGNCMMNGDMMGSGMMGDNFEDMSRLSARIL